MLSPSSNPSLSPKILCFFTLLALINSLFFSSCSSIDEQGQALLAWKTALNSSKDALSSWNSSDQSPCKWFGIHCNSNGDVVKIIFKSVDLEGPLPANFQPLKSLNTLILSSTNLTGPVPKQLGEYRELVEVDISDNSISGFIPVEICGLRKLQTLSLNTNFLEGEIPSEIGNLSSLVILTLYDNRLGGEIPKSVGELRNLEIFRAGGNRNLKGELPREIGNCTKLVTLGLAETSISGSLPSSIGLLKRIQTIAIYTALLSGRIPEEIGNCSELRSLYLHQNSISGGSIPGRIGELKKLQNLFLWQNAIAGSIPPELGSCKELVVVDLSDNLLTGNIPTSFGGLPSLQVLQLSINQLCGPTPSHLTNCTALTHLEVDNNNISGEIPDQIGNLKSLILFFAWQNNLTGKIPDSLSKCENLQALDLSYNNLFGPIPRRIFSFQNLTKLLLLSNDLSGFLPTDIGNCTNLYRFRVNENRLSGTIPFEIGNLRSLNFLDMGNNQFVGGIPPSISGCQNLEFLDLHANEFTGSVPDSLPRSLQFVDISDNRLTGPLTPSIGSLTELTKLNLGKNQILGRIPAEISSCVKLQLLDLGNNGFSGVVPKELGKIPALEISLNLSYNQLTGEIPSEFSGLTKLGILDLSHNKLTGNLNTLGSLQNLVSLNVSFNNFSGELPNTQFFRELPLNDLAGNQGLYVSGGVVTPGDRIGSNEKNPKSTMKLVMIILVGASTVLVLLAVYAWVRTHVARNESTEGENWELTLYQKMEYFSIDDIVHGLTSANVIGTGSSGVVYRVTTRKGETMAVKKMWSSEEDQSGVAFRSEIQTLGSIRHKNIVRLLGWGSNGLKKLLFYDYLPNGSLSSLIHGAASKAGAEWETRYEVLLGVAHALAYLHHDCVPPIMHGDVKPLNVLLGLNFEPYLADFGLAGLVVDNDIDVSSSKQQSPRPLLAGSYGYMAPEHGSMQRISEKSDVYSFGVVILEVLTGRHPLDQTLPGGAQSLPQWVGDHLQRKGYSNTAADILDPKLKLRGLMADHTQMHEILQTLAISLLCTGNRAQDRPTMKDVVAMLKEIRHVDPHPIIRSEPELLLVKKERGFSKSTLPSTTPTPNLPFQLGSSSNCSFAFSDDAI